MNFRVLFLAPLLFAALGRPAFGIITINNDTASLSAPSSGAPWNYVARLDDGFGARASGVYLGNRYILTANHVDNDINLVHLDNTDFTLDGSFTPMAIQGTDMRILRLAQDPALPSLPLITGSQSAFNSPATIIGWGVGKGTAVLNQGWNWGDDTTRFERWGTSTTSGSYLTDSNSGITYLQTTFNISSGAQTGQLTVGDSGGGLFINFGGVWTLVGINAGVDTSGQALYDQSLSIAGNQPDHSYFASVAQFTSQIQTIIGGPPIGGLVQYWDGAGPANNGAIEGGTGSWNTSLTNWANSMGMINSKWQAGTAIFGGTAGTVTLSSGLSAQALTFNTSGYTITGSSALTLAGTAPEIDVTNAGDIATIRAPLAGTKGLTVGGAGRLILTSASNSYTGATTVNTATLQIGTAAAAGKINVSSAVSLSQGGTLSLVNVSGNTFANSVTTGAGGGTLNISSLNITTLSGALTDDGTNSLAVMQTGAGTTILKNANNTYSGATTVTAGTLQIGTTTVAGSIGANSAVSLLNNSTLTLLNVAGNTLTNNIDHTASGGTGVVNVNSSSSVTLSGMISNTGGLLSVTKSGTGTLVMSNPANSYSGGTTLTTGTLIANGSPVDGSGTPLGTALLTIRGGTLGTTLLPTSGYGGTTLPNYISLLGNFSLATNSNPGNPGAQNFTLNGNIDLNGVTRTITGVTNMGQPHFGGIIGTLGETAGVNFNTTFTAAGSYVAFVFDPTNINNYTGQTTVNNGAILVFEGFTPNGAIRGNLDVEGNGVVDYIMGGSSAEQVADTSRVTVNSLGNTVSGLHFDGLELRGASETVASLYGRGRVGLGSGILTVGGGTFTGVIEDGAFGTGGSLIKNDANNTLILSGRNTYTGVTAVVAGRLQAGATNAIPIASVVGVGSGATLDLHNYSQSVGSIADVNGSGGTITLGSAALTTGSDGRSTTFSGVIQNSGRLIKVGSGTLTLAGANTYTGGTTVNAGTLLVKNTTGSGTGTGAVTVNNGATVGGNGTILGAITLNSGGTVAPGAGTPGVAGTTLRATSMMWNAGGTLTLQLGAPGDELVLTGALSKGSTGAYTINILDAGITQTSYTLATFASTNFALTNFTLNLPAGDTGNLILTGTSLVLDMTSVTPASPSQQPSSSSSVEGATLIISSSYNQGATTETISSGQLTTNLVSVSTLSISPTVNLTPTPEPGGVALLTLGAASLLGARRRRAR